MRPWLLGIATNVLLPHSRLRSSEGDPHHPWSGLDYRAAAEALGVPVGTVRS